MRHASVVALCLVLYLSGARADDAPTSARPVDGPADQDIHALERRLVLPRGAGPLRSYIRYYFRREEDEAPVVSAIYIDRAWSSSRGTQRVDRVIVHDESEIDIPEDAECGVIFISYDPRRDRKPSAQCSRGLIGPPADPSRRKR